MIVKCTHCGNEQEYKMRDKIPKRPRTQCKSCGDYFYFKIPVRKKEQKPAQKRAKTNLNYRALLTAVNNYLIAYRKAYESAIENPLSEIKLKYEELLKQKTLLEKKLIKR